MLSFAALSELPLSALPEEEAPPPAPASTVLGSGRPRFDWAEYLSLISEDAALASSQDEDAIVLAACLIAVMEDS